MDRDVAPLTLQLKIEVAPDSTSLGLAVKAPITGYCTTVTVMDWLADMPELEASRV
jgi:hypothetical protein